MRIALVRHFKVKRGYPQKAFITPAELDQWIIEYDESDIEEQRVDLGSIQWQLCYSSDMTRALKTAEGIFQGKINVSKDLREIKPFWRINKNWRLPFILYPLIGRIAWLLKLPSQGEGRDQVKGRAERIIDEVLSQKAENILIVSHGGIMMFLKKELLKRGFRGPGFSVAEHGRLYIFEK
jgi:broad specificity phosphatase PhoE